MSLIHWGETPYLCKVKTINLWGMDPYVFAMSNHITAKLNLWALASFTACQTMDRCSQHPGIFYIQPFCMELIINLLLCIRWVSRRLETKLKKSLPSTFKRAVGRKSESLFWEGLPTLGICISSALHHWMGISHLLKQASKILKRNLLILEHFL